ncbi:MAG: hypothetical protein CVV27_02885 [Candidatus Melainabacteria bacterium HGW-Melainabacteria-1]|nr:MAG: hypothetical protein CVV27_02885 [Candidatus Melainabacteria bacterium HGW-Melainabacteria-1]
MDTDYADLMPVFLHEMQEHLARYEQVLLEFEHAPADTALQELFRILHTLKGSCSLFGFKRLSQLIHRAENLVSGLRSGKLSPSESRLSVLFAFGDTLRQRLDQIQSSGKEPEADDSELIHRLEAGLEVAEPSRTESIEEPGLTGTSADETLAGTYKTESKALGESLLQVDVPRLNRLLDRSAELLLLRHAFFDAITALDPARRRDYQLLCLRYQALALELQDSLLQVRMQPIAQLWKSYPRLVRELKLSTGKQFRLVSEGEETELDKTLIEAIRDPLLHVLRNAVDHGLELPHQRRQAGKTEQGTIQLKASQDDGAILIEISDDGRGIDWDVIMARARKLGYLGPDQEASQDELIGFLLRPGFSTSTQVTELSGRGVGLDVVATNLAQIGGRLDVESLAGQGTCFRLRLPLTLSMLPVLLLRQQGQLLAIPQQDIKEILTFQTLERLSLGGQMACRWRNQTLPLGQLGSLMSSSGSRVIQTDQANGFLIVLQGSQRFALAVEEVLEIRELAIKPLSSHWEAYPLLAGASVLGSGEMALLLSLTALEARICSAESAAESLLTVAAQEAEEPLELASLLLFKDRCDALLALPLPEIAALEQITLSQRLATPAGEVLSHQGELLPLVDVASVLAGENSPGDANWLVICERAGRRIGLLAAEVLDIVPDDASASGPALRAGILGTLALPAGTVERLDPEFIWSRFPAMPYAD